MAKKSRVIGNIGRDDFNESLKLHLMQPDKYPRWILLSLVAAFPVVGITQEIPHLNVTQPGGFPGRPVMNGITAASNTVTVLWDGPAGYYQLYLATQIGGNWSPVGSPNPNRMQTLTNVSGNAFFKVLGPSAQYAGAIACAECHEDIYNLEEATGHPHALNILKNIGQANNPACVPCHSVGFGLPTGFKSEAATPQLAGVQCESCHGPAAVHAANPMDISRRPRADMAGQVCGGCHTGSHHPTYDEWSSSGHFAVVEDMNPTSRISSCGRCHSGSARLALVNGENPAVTVANDANVGITCVVCHDPHQTHTWTNVLSGVVSTNQLRYAVASTNDYVLTTSEVFTNNYNVNINVCAQCHNHRGASWTSTSRPPHHSPQYNVLLGTVGLLPNGVGAIRGTHASLEKQCVTCHMQKEEYTDAAHPAATGHAFEVEIYNACTDCHPYPEGLKDFTAMVFETRINELVTALNLWATTKAPATLQSKYGLLAWEYTNPGELSQGSPGPSTADQALIPDNIKRARFNLYIVKYDGSLGTHNPLHSLDLLDAARDWVNAELYP